MGEARHELNRTSQAPLLRDVSYRRHHVRRLVTLYPDRSHRRRNQDGRPQVAVLDEARGRSDRLHRGTRLHVHPMQGDEPSVRE